jgi:ABC-type dipeptide/oligopeptide/nickel transport system permease subunit
MLCGRFFQRFLEPAMNKLLVGVLATACAVNMACLFGHLSAVAG